MKCSLCLEDQSIFSKASEAQPCILGYGFGLIAATVAASATDVDTIIELGVEGIAIAFRLVCKLQQESRDIEDSSGTWSAIVSGLKPKEIEDRLTRFNGTRKNIRCAYLGQSLPSKAKIFGPPSTLNALAEDADFLHLVEFPRTPFRCALHASHIPEVNVDRILGLSPALDRHRVQRPYYFRENQNHLLSTKEVFHQAVLDIAHNPIQVEKLIEAAAVALRGKTNSKVIITGFGSLDDTSAVCTVFQQHHLDVETDDSKLRPNPGYDAPSTPSDGIAVVGMSGRFPGSDTLDELWHLLQSGTTTHEKIPQSRFPVDEFYDPSRNTHNALFAQHGCFIKRPGDFDHRLFNISPREAQQTDPVQRMLLMTTYEALEIAGLSTAKAQADQEKQNAPRVAVYFGQTTDDWKTINDQQGIDTHYLPGVNRSFAPGRLAHYFRWAGGFYNIDTGCSSSASGICLARNALISGECDAAVVGGGTLLNAPEWFAGLSQGGFLSPTGACKTYSENADGYCRGEGVAVVVLKRLADAVRSKDNILGVLAGAARNCNAGANSITFPGERAQESLYRRILRQAAVRPHNIGMVEMHGTGTQAGDRVELQALANVLLSENGPQRPQPLVVGAIKANLGHSEAAAGVVSLIKALLILRHNTIPPQPGQPISLNPHLKALRDSNIELANGQSWPKDAKSPRYIFVNSFDAAGGNVSMLLRDAPSNVALPPSKQDERTHHVIVTSGRTVKAHDANKSCLREYLAQNPETSLADLAYTTTARRMHHTNRDAFVASSVTDLLCQLEQGNAQSTSLQGSAPAQVPSVVFTFSGQGGQHIGMAKTLYRTSPTFERLMNSYQSILDIQGLSCKLVKIINASEDVGPDMAETGRDMQVAIVALEIALARYWQSLGIRPTLLIGHSIGEYAALCVAGVMSVSDALALTYKRASLIFTKCPFSEAGMLAINLPADTVKSRIQDSAESSACEVSCLNGPKSTVVGGPISAIDAFESSLKPDKTISSTRLRVKHAFHTRQMDAVVDELEEYASNIRFSAPTVPVASTLLGRVVRSNESSIFTSKYIRRHTREPVAFLDAVRICESEGLILDQSVILEIGPHPMCVSLISSALKSVKPGVAPSLDRGHDDWKCISQCLKLAYNAHISVDWPEFHKDFLGSLSLTKDLPTYSFDKQNFWFTYKTDTKVASVGAVDTIQRGTSASSIGLCMSEPVRKEKDRLIANFKASLSDQHLRKAIAGHVVDDAAICPASIFIDMGLTVATYLQEKGRKVQHEPSSRCEMTNLSMQSPMTLGEEDDQRSVLIEGILEQSTGIVSVRFASRQEGAGSIRKEHGSCSVRLEESNNAAIEMWSRLHPLVKARVDHLETSIQATDVLKLDKNLFYKLFSNIVDYSAPYQGVQEAAVAADFHDATFILKLDSSKENSTFTFSPFTIDILVHAAGFLLNADVRKPRNEIDIANHIGSLRILDDSSSCGPFRIYAVIREQDIKSGTSLCDVYVTDLQCRKLVASCTDICFKKLDRDFFGLLTGSARIPSSNTRQLQHGRRGNRQRAVAADSSDSSSTDQSEESSSMTNSSLSEAVDLSVEMFKAISDRSGVSISELEDATDSTFADMGVDSQMSIAILADFHRATAVELPAAFFTNFPTPSDVQKELGNRDIPEQEAKPRARSENQSSSKQQVVKQRKAQPSEQLLRHIADTLGLAVDELAPSVTFGSLGLDSMLSIKILALFHKSTDIELPASFFSENRTVAAAKAEIDGSTGHDDASGAPLEQSSHDQKQLQAVETPEVKPSRDTTSRQRQIENATSRAVLIQGQSRSRAPPLFMTTDGSGTVESYIHLKSLREGRRIYALESPFVDTPDSFDLSIEEMASIFIRTIRRIQPRGPYLIGGWSAGSIYAYEVAHRLAARQGETVAALIILDMRAPSLIPTEIVTTDFVDKLGTFEGINRARNLPEDLSVREKTHLMATCRALSRYDAPPFPLGRRPRHVAVVWARLGLDDRADAPVAAMGRPGSDVDKGLSEMTLDEFERYFNSWFYGRREQFGMNGWETLVGDEISVHCVDGGMSFIYYTLPLSN